MIILSWMLTLFPSNMATLFMTFGVNGRFIYLIKRKVIFQMKYKNVSRHLALFAKYGHLLA